MQQSVVSGGNGRIGMGTPWSVLLTLTCVIVRRVEHDDQFMVTE